MKTLEMEYHMRTKDESMAFLFREERKVGKIAQYFGPDLNITPTPVAKQIAARINLYAGTAFGMTRKAVY